MNNKNTTIAGIGAILVAVGGTLGRIELGVRIHARISGQKREVRVLDVVDGPPVRAVIPQIADHAVRRRVRAGRERRVPDHRLGIGVVMMRVRIVDTPLEQVLETALAELPLAAGIRSGSGRSGRWGGPPPLPATRPRGG